MLGFDSSNQSPVIRVCSRRVKCPGTQTVVRGKEIVSLLWFVIPVKVASVDVDGTVILKVESVCGCEQIWQAHLLANPPPLWENGPLATCLLIARNKRIGIGFLNMSCQT